MGTEIMQIHDRTDANVARTIALARSEALVRQTLAETGGFSAKERVRTCDFEHEAFAVNRTTGEPIDAISVFSRDDLGTRPDTTRFIVEYDANGPTPITSDGLNQLYRSFVERTREIESCLPDEAMLVPMGVHPFLSAAQASEWLDSGNIDRYRLLNQVTQNENPVKTICTRNSLRDYEVVETAANLTAMTRCAATQFHISEVCVEDALDAQVTATAIAPVKIALFGSSPFMFGMDTGKVSSRIDLLGQSEQRRSGLTQPSATLFAYYNRILHLDPPFMEIVDQRQALELTHGATHPVSRIIADPDNQTIRVEYRHDDSLPPFEAMQSFLFTLGAVEAFRYSDERPSFSQSLKDFKTAPLGLFAPMHWNGQSGLAKELGLVIIGKVTQSLNLMGLGSLADEFLDPLTDQIASGITQADKMKEIYYNDIDGGATLHQAAVEVMRYRNRQGLMDLV